MAAISIINNGEAMSSVRSKLNNVITEVNLLDPTDWIDYSSTSTIVGWSSFTVKIIRYRVIGKQVCVQYQLQGTSISATTTFTLPNTSINIEVNQNNLTVDNSVVSLGLLQITSNSNIVSFAKWTAINSNTSTFTASGTKMVKGQFFYEIA